MQTPAIFFISSICPIYSNMFSLPVRPNPHLLLMKTVMNMIPVRIQTMKANRILMENHKAPILKPPTTKKLQWPAQVYRLLMFRHLQWHQLEQRLPMKVGCKMESPFNRIAENKTWKSTKTLRREK